MVASPVVESSVERGLPMKHDRCGIERRNWPCPAEQRELNMSSQTQAKTILCKQRSPHQ
jgi:hypothetical protein